MRLIKDVRLWMYWPHPLAWLLNVDLQLYRTIAPANVLKKQVEKQVEDQQDDELERRRLGRFNILAWKCHSWPSRLQRCMDSTFRRNSFGRKRTRKLSWQMCCWKQTELQLDTYHSRVFWYYLSHDGKISCEVTGRRKFGKGLEVPCIYRFLGSEKLVKKMKSIIIKKLSKI